jgi:hypothetical protein
MPTFIDGQINLAALQVPGLYIDIIPPSPFINGAPTNTVGFVGVGSWGPVDSIINLSSPDDCAYKLGRSQIRAYDIAFALSCAVEIGGAANFACVRVSDSTDLAATAQVQPAKASGGITIPTQPTANQTLSIGGTTVTFVATGATGNQVNIGANVAATLVALAAFLNASADVNISKATYTVVGSVLQVSFDVPGAGGNSFPLATNVTGASVSGSTLSGGGAAMTLTALYTGSLGNTVQFSLSQGSAPNSFLAAISFPGRPPEIFNNIVGTGAAFWTNLASAINNGTAYRARSNYLVATAGGLAAAPTLATPVTLSGGTDGASGVTDETLIGIDIQPRSGMYALRSTGVDSFHLIDIATVALWPTMDVFAESEDCLACYAGANGDTYEVVAAKRVSVGLDSFYDWISSGDYPSFYDAVNGVTRLCNPGVVQAAFCGNASPEQSPLNKRLRGVVSTESTVEGTTYSDADLSIINTSGIDVIIGPPTTLGGDYYAFASGRNASSNTAGNGVEYSRVTNFIARSLNSFAVKAIVGMLQSSRPDDPTRAKAKQLVDGFFAQLANPESGSSGQGIIDNFFTICDLTNNPLPSEAQGYLFLNAQVRYLNTVRYFVVKLAGGGNVNVVSSDSSFAQASALLAAA